MASAAMKFSAILFLIATSVAVNVSAANSLQHSVTEVCLDCMCHAIYGCEQGLQCEGDTCGSFRITWPYWVDGGQLTINGLSSDHPDAFRTCVVNRQCAVETIQGYMRRYGRDCNGDGIVNCYDYMAIHEKGPYGCSYDLPYEILNAFNQCIAAQQRYN